MNFEKNSFRLFYSNVNRQLPDHLSGIQASRQDRTEEQTMGLDDHENLMSKPPAHSGGPSGGASIGNYKGVMLCSRPAAPAGADIGGAGGLTTAK